MAINAKREQIRDQIRKKERQAFFMQQRLKNISELRGPSSSENLVQLLRQKDNVEGTLQLIITKVSSSDMSATMQLIQQGLISVIFAYLQEQAHLAQTLEIISFLVENCAPKPHFFDVHAQFYNLGILQQLAKHLNPSRGGILSAFIIYRLSQASQDYCEAILESRLYELLMRQAAQHILEQSLSCENQSQAAAERFFAYVLKTLQNLVELKQSVMDYSSQKREVLQFMEFLLARRLFLTHAFAVVYEALRADKGLAFANLTPLINQIVSEGHSDSRHMQNLLATIYLLTPDTSLNYSLCFQTALKIPKTYKLLSAILERLLKNYIQAVPTNQLFWQKALAGSSNDEDTFKRLVRVAGKVALGQSLVCRIIGVSLEKECSLAIQREGLEILEGFVKSEKHLDGKLLELNKQRIPDMLNQLCESSSLKVKEKAAWLLDYILGPMTEMAERIESL